MKTKVWSFILVSRPDTCLVLTKGPKQYIRFYKENWRQIHKVITRPMMCEITVTERLFGLIQTYTIREIKE